MAQFTQREKDIVNDGNANQPLRVLKVTDKDDLEILRTKCEDIEPVTDNHDLMMLIERMYVTMEAEQGVGIAAPQVGVTKNILLFVRTDEEGYPVEAAINPRIVGYADNTICFEGDGCLSIPGISENTIRYPWIDVEYTNIQGQLVKERLEGYSREGNFAAVIFQHEYDHLQGVLFTDKACTEEEKSEK